MYSFLWVLGWSAFSGICYWFGGRGDEWRKRFPRIAFLFNTKTRDIGCPLATLMCVPVQFAWWKDLLSFLLLFAALTTYWDDVFGKDNYFAHGFMCGLAYLPYCIGSNEILGIVLFRSILLAVLMGVWSHKIRVNTHAEDIGRGVVLPLTAFLLYVLE